MNAQEAIAKINEAKLQLPFYELSRYTTAISRAAIVNHDEDAIRWLYLLNWNPQQLVN